MLSFFFVQSGHVNLLEQNALLDWIPEHKRHKGNSNNHSEASQQYQKHFYQQQQDKLGKNEMLLVQLRGYIIRAIFYSSQPHHCKKRTYFSCSNKSGFTSWRGDEGRILL